MGVAELVRAQATADAATGDPRAIFILPHIDRKLVKQTVMTSVYGVTFIGARQQVLHWPPDASLHKQSGAECLPLVASTSVTPTLDAS